MMLGIILVMSRISRTEMVTRLAVSRERKSLVFLFLITMARKRMLRRRARKEMAAQEIHHQVAPGTTCNGSSQKTFGDGASLMNRPLYCIEMQII